MSGDTALLKPELYDRDASGRVALKGGKCSACGYAFFPMQDRGCEKCGAHGLALHESDLGGTGRLMSAARVHFHAGKTRTAPFTIGVVALDSGPVVRTLLQDAPDAERSPGMRLAAILVETHGSDGRPALDLRFRPEQG